MLPNPVVPFCPVRYTMVESVLVSVVIVMLVICGQVMFPLIVR